MMENQPDRDRCARLGVLASADPDRLRALWADLGPEPAHRPLRGPETGLVMLRGRIGGTGAPFNIGEATVTRATVRLESGAVGHAMRLGRDAGAARLSALIDALCQDPEAAARIEARLVRPLRAEMAARDARRREETAATRVDFFTLARGED